MRKYSLRWKILSLILAVSLRVTVCFTRVDIPYCFLFLEESNSVVYKGKQFHPN